MPIELPNLDRTTITHLSICAFAEGETELAAKWLSRKKTVDLDCEYSVDGARHRLSLDLNEDDDGDLHIHINVSPIRVLVESSLPKQRGTIEGVQKELARLIGAKLFRTIVADVRIPLSDLPETGIVNSLSAVSTMLDKSPVTLTGAELSISEGPVKRVKWSRRTESLYGEITVREAIKLSDKYLVRAAKLIEGGVSAIFLTGSRNE